MSNETPQHPKIIEPEYFSTLVLNRAYDTAQTLLETLVLVTEELDIDEDKVKRLITAPLMSRLEAECADSKLLKVRCRSKKLI